MTFLAVNLAVLAFLCWATGSTAAAWLFGTAAATYGGLAAWGEIRYRVLLRKWRARR